MEDEKLATGEEAANLENEALKRKKRIEALRQLKEQQTKQSSTEAQQQSLPRYPSISNYINNIYSQTGKLAWQRMEIN